MLVVADEDAHYALDVELSDLACSVQKSLDVLRTAAVRQLGLAEVGKNRNHLRLRILTP